jgi:predicted metal-dependent HD superfamily phosphohydrolase
LKEEIPEFTAAESFICSQLKENLSPSLLYHNIEHTLDVLDVAMKIAEAEQISTGEINLLRIAVLFHDAGFIYVYQDHEAKGCEMARECLPRFGFTKTQIDMICQMIMTTMIPQRPKTILDRIIADADLDYLGRNDVYIIAQKLHNEMHLHNLLTDENKWIPFQIEFLKQHHYFTDYSRKNREANKNSYLCELMQKIKLS